MVKSFKAKLSEDQEDPEFSQKITSLQIELSKVQTIQKENSFEEEVTKEEEEIINQRVTLQQQMFKLYHQRDKRKQLKRIKKLFEYIKPKEIEEALKENNNKEEEVIHRFLQEGYLKEIRQKITQGFKVERILEMSDEQKNEYKLMVQKRKLQASKITNSESKLKVIRHSKMKLDDALKQLSGGGDPEKVFEGWSEARIKAYSLIHTKPNSYYYRFNAPGEKQGSGGWSKDEKTLFFNRLKEMGADGQWGIFSTKIPGRVGYQVYYINRSARIIIDIY
jgi:predicted transcriptional regulator